MVFRYGDPTSITEARNMVEKAEERMAFSDDESSEDEKEKPKKSDVNWTRKFFRNTVKKCQKCDSTNLENQHEALTCTKTACAYCGVSFHVTKLCNIIAENRRIKMICKLCSSPTHTIDFCPNKNDDATYCQYCQDSNCYASRCDKIKAAKTCSICGDQEHEYGKACPMNHITAKNGQQRQQGPCYNCQGPHIAAHCPEKQNSDQNMQMQQYRGNQNQNYRGGNNRGYQYNGQRTYYRGGGYQNGQQNQNRGGGNYRYYGQNNGQYNQNRGGNYRGNNYRGNNYRGNYNQNYRGNGDNNGQRNNRDQRSQEEADLQRMTGLFQDWLRRSFRQDQGAQQGAIPKITYPNEPKN